MELAKKTNRISEVLNKLLFERKIRATELARKIDVPQPTLHRIVSGKSPNPHISTIKPIAEFFNISIEQLKGERSLTDDSSSKLVNKHDLIQVPLYRWENLSIWYGGLETEQCIVATHDISDDAFAVYMRDSSMEPQFARGTTLIIDPNKKSNDRSYVLVKLAENGFFIFRQLLIDADYYFLKALNSDLNTFPMRLLHEDDQICGVLVEARHTYNDC